MHGPEDYMNYDTSEVFAMAGNKDVEGLIGVLMHNKNKHVVKRAIFALGEIKDKKAVEPLIEVGLKSVLITIRGASVRALGDVGSNEAVEPLIYAMLKEKVDTGKVEAAQALSKIKDSRAIKPLSMLMNDEAEDLNVREEMAEALGKIATEEAIHSLIAALDSELREKVSEVLKEVEEPAVMPLIGALSGGNEPIIWEVSTILGEIGDERATEPLIAILEDANEDSELREKAVHALGKIKDTRAVEPLIRAAVRDTNYAIRCWSATALGDIGDTRAVEPLIDILLDKSSTETLRIRGHAAEALGKIGNNAAVEPLITALEDHREEEWVRNNAARALLEMDDDRIEIPLLKYFKVKLGDIAKSEAYEHDSQWGVGVIEGVRKLITRLIDKS